MSRQAGSTKRPPPRAGLAGLLVLDGPGNVRVGVGINPQPCLQVRAKNQGAVLRAECCLLRTLRLLAQPSSQRRSLLRHGVKSLAATLRPQGLLYLQAAGIGFGGISIGGLPCEGPRQGFLAQLVSFSLKLSQVEADRWQL